MLGKIEDLQQGDEILVASGGSFRHYRLLKTPELRKDKAKDWKGNPLYRGIKCSTRIVERSTTFQNGYVRTWKVYECSDNHNATVSLNLKHKDFFILKSKNK